MALPRRQSSAGHESESRLRCALIRCMLPPKLGSSGVARGTHRLSLFGCAGSDVANAAEGGRLHQRGRVAEQRDEPRQHARYDQVSDPIRRLGHVREGPTGID